MVQVCATIAFGAASIWGFALCLTVAESLFGAVGLVLAALFFPVTVLAAPLYALFALGDPLPVLLLYGGGFLT